MRHIPGHSWRRLHAGKSLSSSHLNNQSIINSLWVVVDENCWHHRCYSGCPTVRNFADTIGKPITFYTQQAETIRLVEEQLAAAVRDSKPAQEGDAAPLTDATQDDVRGGDAMRIARYRNTRYWAVIDTEDTLVCLCVYRKGAMEVVRRLETRTTA